MKRMTAAQIKKMNATFGRLLGHVGQSVPTGEPKPACYKASVVCDAHDKYFDTKAEAESYVRRRKANKRRMKGAKVEMYDLKTKHARFVVRIICDRHEKYFVTAKDARAYIARKVTRLTEKGSASIVDLRTGKNVLRYSRF